MDKNHPGQSPWTKTPRTIKREFVHELLSGLFVLGLLKIGGSEMCDVLWGVPGCGTQCDRERGSKLAKNSMTCFMDGPDANSVMITVKSISRKMSFSILINAQQFNLSCDMIDQYGSFMSSRRENSTYICRFISL